MALVFKSLDAVTSLGAGHEAKFDTPKMSASMQISVTGAPSDARVDLEVTVDGQQFVRVVEIELVGGTTAFAPSVGPFVGARANLTQLTGGTSPTVTAVIAVA